MTLTTKMINLLDKIKADKFFIEEDKKVFFKFISFDPKMIESSINKVLRTQGRFYHMNELEKEIMKELEYRPH